jgi:cytochrome c oxidase subunit 1
MIFGGIILTFSAGLLIYILLKTQLSAGASFKGEVEFAEPVHKVVGLPNYLNSFSLWNGVIAIFMLIAFGYPILQFFIMKTFGSSTWGY